MCGLRVRACQTTHAPPTCQPTNQPTNLKLKPNHNEIQPEIQTPKPDNSKPTGLEVTYNYGVEAYATGSGLASFAVAVPDAVESARLATSLGYHVRHVGNQGAGGVMVLGPDGYRFSLVDKKASACVPYIYQFDCI